ncbi:hypothetical protein ES5_10237 [Dietzia cinnamea P4]|nr:hypothetical protein ES5_10237 [Dietzia cinnamea P4]
MAPASTVKPTAHGTRDGVRGPVHGGATQGEDRGEAEHREQNRHQGGREPAVEPPLPGRRHRGGDRHDSGRGGRGGDRVATIPRGGAGHVRLGQSLQDVVEQRGGRRHRAVVQHEDLAVVDALLGEGLRHGQRAAGQSGQLPGPAGAAAHPGVDVHPRRRARHRADVVADEVHDLRDHRDQLEVGGQAQIHAGGAAHH